MCNSENLEMLLVQHPPYLQGRTITVKTFRVKQQKM